MQDAGGNSDVCDDAVCLRAKAVSHVFMCFVIVADQLCIQRLAELPRPYCRVFVSQLFLG